MYNPESRPPRTVPDGTKEEVSAYAVALLVAHSGLPPVNRGCGVHVKGALDATNGYMKSARLSRPETARLISIRLPPAYPRNAIEMVSGIACVAFQACGMPGLAFRGLS